MDRRGLTGGGSNPLLAVALFSLLILLSAVILVDLHQRGQPLGIDFAPVWAAATVPHEAYDMDPERFWLFFQQERPGVTREQMIEALIASGDESDAA